MIVVKKFITYIGLLILLLGMSAMDSEKLLIPTVAMLLGGTMLYITRDKEPDDGR